eukprot:11218992-Lingulodinium_polyedra.AAC.1
MTIIYNQCERAFCGANELQSSPCTSGLAIPGEQQSVWDRAEFGSERQTRSHKGIDNKEDVWRAQVLFLVKHDDSYTFACPEL